MVANIGCGNLPVAGAINVDIRLLPCVDVIADIRFLPFKNNSFEYVYSSDVIEHVRLPYYFSAIDELCRICNRRLILKTPVFDRIAQIYCGGKIDITTAVLMMFGAQDYPENTHYAVYDSGIVRRQIERNNFCILDESYCALGTMTIEAERIA